MSAAVATAVLLVVPASLLAVLALLAPAIAAATTSPACGLLFLRPAQERLDLLHADAAGPAVRRAHQAGGLWARGALNGKVGGAFTSTATQHGGQALEAQGYPRGHGYHSLCARG